MFLQPKELPVDGLELHRPYPWRSHSLCGVRKNPCIRFASFFSVNKDSTGVGYSLNDQFCEPIRELLSLCHILIYSLLTMSPRVAVSKKTSPQIVSSITSCFVCGDNCTLPLSDWCVCDIDKCSRQIVNGLLRLL